MDVGFDFLPFGYENIFGKDHSYFSYDFNLHITERGHRVALRKKNRTKSGQSSIQQCLFFVPALYIFDLGSLNMHKRKALVAMRQGIKKKKNQKYPVEFSCKERSIKIQCYSPKHIVCILEAYQKY